MSAHTPSNEKDFFYNSAEMIYSATSYGNYMINEMGLNNDDKDECPSKEILLPRHASRIYASRIAKGLYTKAVKKMDAFVKEHDNEKNVNPYFIRNVISNNCRICTLYEKRCGVVEVPFMIVILEGVNRCSKD